MSPEQLSLMELALTFRMPLYKLLNEMPYEEFLLWGEYFEERPLGAREDYRAALLISAQQPKVDILKLFPSLSPRSEKAEGLSGLKNSQFYQFMKNSSGGVILGD